MRIAVAGCAHPHVEYVLDEITAVPGHTLVGVADPDPESARRYADPHQAPVFTDTLELITTTAPELVYAAGVYSERADVIVTALEAGCHVVTDKPMCTTRADLARIRAAAETAPGHLSLLLEKRYYPETRALFALHAAGTLGDIVAITSAGPHKLNPATRPDWFFDPHRYGGLLNDLAVHDLDLALLLLAEDEVTVRGSLPTAGPGTEPFARAGSATVTGSRGIASIHVDWLTPAGSPVHGDYQLRVTGTRGVAEVYWARGELVLTTDDAGPHRVDLPAATRPAETVLAALAAGLVPDVDAAASLRATEAALLAQASAEQGGTPFPLPSVTAGRPVSQPGQEN